MKVLAASLETFSSKGLSMVSEIRLIIYFGRQHLLQWPVLGTLSWLGDSGDSFSNRGKINSDMSYRLVKQALSVMSRFIKHVHA